jgi:hypothetical protein
VPYLGIPPPAKPTMPRLVIDLGLFHIEIKRRIANKDTQASIRDWLVSQGAQISKNTLSYPELLLGKLAIEPELQLQPSFICCHQERLFQLRTMMTKQLQMSSLPRAFLQHGTKSKKCAWHTVGDGGTAEVL